MSDTTTTQLTDTTDTTNSLRPTPSVTLVLVAYNHEAFIEEAVASCLAMDYSPMQIVLSDDCSSDRTFEIMQGLVDAYDGPNEVVLNRNDENHYMEHLSRLLPRLTGDLVVLACGDDVQHPDRVAKVVERWRQTGATLLTNQARVIDDSGRGDSIYPDAPASTAELSLEHFLPRAMNAACFGAGLSWHRELTDTFGPVRIGARNMDRIFPFRALLMNGCEFIAEPLMGWRHHGDNMTIALRMAQSADKVEHGMWIQSNHLNDMANFYAMIEDAQRYLAPLGRQAELAKITSVLSNNLTGTIRKWLPVRHVLAQNKVKYH